MEVSELFNGIAVIIDDEIDDTTSSIFKIKKNIQNRNIPVVTYKEPPKKDTVKALADASFLIVDWDYARGSLDIDGMEERVALPQDFKESNQTYLVDFLKAVNDSIFVPVFIFTSQNTDSIKTKLKESGMWDEDERKNRIFIKSKSEIDSETELFKAMSDWLKGMPSVYMLKKWEQNVQKTKNSMFVDLYSRSPEWVGIIWNMMKRDTLDYQQEFGDFITRTLTNRMDGFYFDEEIIGLREGYDDFDNIDELRTVIEGERYLSYHEETVQTPYYTGDLFVDGRTFYLNIRAQCDLSRERNGEYDPALYLIKGKRMRDADISMGYISISPEGHLDYGNGKSDPLEAIIESCADKEKIESFNRELQKAQNKTFLRYGSFIERANKVIVGCIGGEKTIEFKLELIIKKRSELQAKRIGRLLPPYITRIQQKCAQYIIREGVMPIPKELYE